MIAASTSVVAAAATAATASIIHARIIINISRVLERIVAIAMIEAYVMTAIRLLPTLQIALYL